MIPTLLPSLERHGRLKLDQAGRALVLGVSAATIDRLLVETKIAAAGGKRRRVGFYSAVRREVPIRTFNDWHDPPPGFCEVDMGGPWRHIRGWLVYPDIDDGRCRHWLDRVHAVVDARERCVYRKSRFGSIGDEVHHGSGVSERFRSDESDEKPAHPCAKTDAFWRSCSNWRVILDSS